MNEIHPLVKAEVMHLAARAQRDLEALQHKRDSASTLTPLGEDRALSLGRQVRELRKIALSWQRIADAMGRTSPSLDLMVGDPEDDGSIPL
jgi:hypothetical protein